MVGATTAAAEWISGLTIADVPVEARTASKLALLDCIGVAAAATTEPLGRAVLAHARSTAGPPVAGVLASSIRTGAEQAAFANGVLAHALDYDDTWAPPAGVAQVTASHPTCTLLPTLLALGEHEDVSGADLLVALVAGYELHGKLGFPDRTSVRSGFHGSAVFGAVAAAGAAARLVGLDAAGTAVAIAIGAANAAGVNVNRGTMTKPYQIGNVSAGAVRAALLARAGLSGPGDAIEGKHGFAHGFMEADRWDEAVFVQSLGERLSIVRPGVEMKRHASCFLTHRAIDAALQIARTHDLRAADVSSVTVIAPPGSIVNRPRPATGIEAKFSLQYTVARALISRDLGHQHFSEEAIRDAEVSGLMARVAVVEDAALDSDFPLVDRPVEVRLEDGAVLDDAVATPPGHWVAPMEQPELVAKFQSATAQVLAADRQREVVDLVLAMESCASVRRLGELLTTTEPSIEREQS